MTIEEDIEHFIADAKQAAEQAIGSDMESYLDGRISAFEDILDILKAEKKDENRRRA